MFYFILIVSNYQMNLLILHVLAKYVLLFLVSPGFCTITYFWDIFSEAVLAM